MFGEPKNSPDAVSFETAFTIRDDLRKPINDAVRSEMHMEAKDPTEDLTWYNSEMEECANGYVAFVMELVEEAKKTCPDPVVLIEQRLDYWHYAYLGSVQVKIGSGTSSKIGFFAGTPIARQTLSTYSQNMGYSAATSSNYLKILNNLVGILVKYGMIGT